MEFIKEDKNSWYFIHDSNGKEPIKICLSLRALNEESIIYPSDPPTILRIIAESLSRDAELLKQEYIDNLLPYLESRWEEINPADENYYKEYGVYLERLSIFLNKEKKLSNSDFIKLRKEVKLLCITFELYVSNANSEMPVIYCSAYVIDPFMTTWVSAIENKYNDGEGFIEFG